MKNTVLTPIKSLFHNSDLIISLSKREISARYQGSVLGLFWSLITPLIMLIVYTFVFSVVFKAKWGVQSNSQVEFAVILFIGLLIYNTFAEVLLKSPGLITGNTNYVKKIVFPLEILPVVTLISALFNFLTGLLIWFLAYMLFFGMPNTTIFYLPLILLPMCFLAIGFSWILSSLGVYIRDITQIVSLITTMLMFLSPIFYPTTALPDSFQKFLNINPLTFIIEQSRNVLMWDQNPDWISLLYLTMLSLMFAVIGLIFFQKTRGGFADVL